MDWALSYHIIGHIKSYQLRMTKLTSSQDLLESVSALM